ncbi:MAG: long-chain acyl-CoA synthetase [Rickettsiales bacterium]|jgi:long-chain acyl-CoA synthetase
MENFSNLASLIDFLDQKYQNPKAFSSVKNGQSTNISTENFTKNIRHLTLSLNDLGIKKNDGFAIIAKPSHFWLQIDLAAIANGAFSVPIFPNISSENLLFEIKNSGAKFVFCDSMENLQIIHDSGAKFQKIIILDFETKGENIIKFEDLLKNGAELFQKSPNLFNQLTNQINENDLATIIYTSGSTGVPKGVEITHKNLISQINSTAKCFPLNKNEDVALSFLPLAHIFERMVVLYYISQGITVHFADDVKNVGALLKEINPSLMTAVPRMLEKVFAKMQNGVNEASFIKKLIGKLAFFMAPKFAADDYSNGLPRRFTPRNDDVEDLFPKLKTSSLRGAFLAKPKSGRGNPEGFKVSLNILYKILNHLVYKKLRAALGSKMRMIICGGAALSPDLEKFFLGIGINIYVGYGLTESSPVIAANFRNNHKLGSVGKAFPNVEVRLGEDRELLVKGSSIMRGYHKDPIKTAQEIDENGWLKTGDLAEIDADGFIKIIGRKKEMFKTTYGKYVSPVPIEQKLIAGWSLLSATCIIAEGKKFVSCLLFVEFDLLKKYQEKHGFKNLSPKDFLKSEFIQKRSQKLINDINKNLNHWEKIQKFHLSTKPISIEGGEITPSMKLRRNIVEEKFKDVIAEFYS